MSHILIDNPDGWTSLAIIENNVPKLDTKPLSWFNDSGNPLTKEEIINLGYYGVKYQHVSFDSELEKVLEDPIENAIIDHKNHQITITHSVVPLSEKELSDRAREKRNRLLQDSDVLVYPDVWEETEESKKTIIKEYRKNLRDLPIQENFPHEIVWPSLKELYPNMEGGGNVVVE